MSYQVSAQQARTTARNDLTIFDETSALMRQVIVDASAGAYTTTVSDGTTMTESTPQTLKIATVNNPVITSGSTLEINGATIVLGTSGTNLNCVVADINDTEIPGVVASKDGGYLVLEITGTSSNWEYSIGAGTANVELGLTTGNYMITAPNSVDYFSVWQGTETERALQNQMNQVIKHFVNLGFKIEQVTNTATGKTFSWNVYW